MSRSSTELAADSSLLEIWDRRIPFPAAEDMEDLDAVTHVAVERAQAEGYHYLHESAMAFHQGVLHLGWANHRVAEFNICDELLRGRRSADGGLTWGKPQTWVQRPDSGSISFNHPVLCAAQGKLWGFFVRWDGDMTTRRAIAEGLTCCDRGGPQPSTELFVFDDDRQAWTSQHVVIPGFLSFGAPIRLRNGNWLVSGELSWYEAAVAISDGDDWTRWRVVQIPRPAEIDLLFPETTVIDQGHRLLAIVRPKGAQTASASESTDGGESWPPLRLSNFPLSESKPLGRRLSTGQHIMVTCGMETGRSLLSIAVGEPGAATFSRIWKIRHQQYPRRRFFPGYLVGGKIQGDTRGAATEWSYPAAVEHDGKLYVSYTQGKEDCVLSIIPLTSLAVGR